MNISRIERTFQSVVVDRGVFVETISPEVGNGRWILILHGLGDHFGRHEWAVQFFTGLGYSVIGFDWPGNGRSGGKRGDLPATRAVARLLEEVLTGENIQPDGILAHSTGCFFLIHAWSEKISSLQDVRWVWLSSPLLRPDYGQAAWKIGLARKLAKYFPEVSVSTGVHPVDCYHLHPGEDPVHFREGSHNRISFRAGLDLILEGEKMAAPVYAEALDLPLLITQGADDEVCPPQFAEEFFRRLPAARATMLLIAGARHEPFREPNRAEMLSQARAWLRLQAGGVKPEEK